MQDAVLHFAFAVMRQHEIEDRFGALMNGQGVRLRDALALQTEIFLTQFFQFFIARPLDADAAFGDPQGTARGHGSEVGVELGIILQRLVMVQVEGVEVRPGFVVVEIGEGGGATNGKDVLAGNDIRVARFESEVRGLLE